MPEVEVGFRAFPQFSCINPASGRINKRQRLEGQVVKKEAGDLEAHSVDEDFITALEYGMQQQNQIIIAW